LLEFALHAAVVLDQPTLCENILVYGAENTFNLRIDDEVIGLALRPVLRAGTNPKFKIIQLLLKYEVALKLGPV
jgi:hypothetical protein